MDLTPAAAASWSRRPNRPTTLRCGSHATFPCVHINAQGAMQRAKELSSCFIELLPYLHPARHSEHESETALPSAYPTVKGRIFCMAGLPGCHFICQMGKRGQPLDQSNQQCMGATINFGSVISMSKFKPINACVTLLCPPPSADIDDPF
eukprot:365973-Chlamydomonas_euryale.AAC.8